MSIVVLVLLIATVGAAIGMLAAMFVKDRPIYGAAGVGLMLAPATILSFAYLAVA